MKVFTNAQAVKGPLLIAECDNAAFKELVSVTRSDGSKVQGQVLEVFEKKAVIQIFEGTQGLGVDNLRVKYLAKTATVGVGENMLGRVFDGMGQPIDGLEYFPESQRDINGAPINPVARIQPDEFIQTGVSTIDCMMPLCRGQKLPIFAMNGLPYNKLAAQIARQAKVLDGKEFAVVFVAMGSTHAEADFFREEFEKTGALNNTVLFLNLASDPSVARIMTPRLALTAAEYLAFEKGKQVLVIMTDMTNYCESLREISAIREEVPGRRGYPGYMYTDLASLYERAGKIETSDGSVTQIPILTMPADDKTHPVPDLTGYITEGQILLDRGLFKRSKTPPITILGSLSRLKVKKGQVREDAAALADQLYAAYATGIEFRDLVAVVGKSALSDRDVAYLDFAQAFEEEFINQGFQQERSINETLDIGWKLLTLIPKSELKKVKEEHIKKYYPQ